MRFVDIAPELDLRELKLLCEGHCVVFNVTLDREFLSIPDDLTIHYREIVESQCFLVPSRHTEPSPLAVFDRFLNGLNARDHFLRLGYWGPHADWRLLDSRSFR
jgi:hypothetical protein